MQGDTRERWTKWDAHVSFVFILLFVRIYSCLLFRASTHTKIRHPQDNSVDTRKLALLSKGLSGAEVVGVCREAAILAMEEDIDAEMVCGVVGGEILGKEEGVEGLEGGGVGVVRVE